MTRGSFQKSGERTERGRSMTQQDEKKAVVVTDPGLLNRTSWTNASVALTHIKKVRSYGGPWSRVDQTQPWRGLYSMSGWRLLTLTSIEPSQRPSCLSADTQHTPVLLNFCHNIHDRIQNMGHRIQKHLAQFPFRQRAKGGSG